MEKDSIREMEKKNFEFEKHLTKHLKYCKTKLTKKMRLRERYEMRKRNR